MYSMEFLIKVSLNRGTSQPFTDCVCDFMPDTSKNIRKQCLCHTNLGLLLHTLKAECQASSRPQL